jgi:acyl-CoA synthetase (AMP-forming)/AMP-acid ligase II
MASSTKTKSPFPEIDLFPERHESVNVLDFLWLHAQNKPSQLAYRWVDEKSPKENTSLTYAQLWERIRTIASRLRATGLSIV